MGKVAFFEIFKKIEARLDARPRHDTNPTVLPAIHRVFIFLQFMRTNEFQRAVGTQSFLRVSQTVVCKTVNKVASILVGMVQDVSL